MGHLLKIEWLKLKNYRTFWILSILFIISIFGFNYLIHNIFARDILRNPTTSIFVGGPPFQFPQVWHSVSFLSGFLLFIPGLLLIISVTNEYSYKTHRQNIIDGLSRAQFITIKMVAGLIISFISTIIVFLIAFFFGIAEGGGAVSFDGLYYIGYFFLQALSYIGMALLFSILFKRSGITIGVYFLYSLILENMIAGALNRYVGHTGYFLPLHSGNSLISFPFFHSITSRIIYQPDISYMLITVFIYFILYIFFILRKFKTVDL